jgi:hypothetical protein
MIIMTVAVIALVPASMAGQVVAPTVGTTGPFVGILEEGDTDTHAYDNNPTGQPCIQLAATYIVRLAYSPPTDTLTLTAAEKTATGSDGTAGVSFTKGVCASFAIHVEGTSVDSTATYTVTVDKIVSGGGGSPA